MVDHDRELIVLARLRLRLSMGRTNKPGPNKRCDQTRTDMLIESILRAGQVAVKILKALVELGQVAMKILVRMRVDVDWPCNINLNDL